MSELNAVDFNEMLAVGTTLQGGKYRVEKCLASGGFGNTYVVINTKFDERMAMKEFFMRGVSERHDHNTVSVSNAANQQSFDSQRDKFNKEARRLRKLHNQHIVQVHDLFDENDTSYYVMDYVDGESLSQRLKRTNRPLGEDEALGVLDQVLDALDAVHAQGIWHLDLKPGNVMVDSQGVVKVIDFGASKQLTAGQGYTTTTTAMCYTPGYAPPEQIDQKIENIGPWTDLYALGATFYHILTGKEPPKISELRDEDAFIYPTNVSDSSKELIQWMMQAHRSDRPQSVEDVKNYLGEKMDFDDEEKTILNGISKNESIEEDALAGGNSKLVSKPWWKSKKLLGVLVGAVALFGLVGWFAFGTDKAQSYYEQGEALYDKKEYDEAVQFFKKAADLNHADAQNKLGLCYYHGTGVTENFEQAVLWWRKAAEHGDACAQYSLGYCYENGQGVGKNLEYAQKCYQQAIPGLIKAADSEESKAQYYLGVCFEHGRGVTKDFKQAVEWYRKAADQGNADAQNNLGVCYKNGTGVEKNPEKAVYWYRKAAEQGNALAQNNLGWCYEYGEGVEKNLEKAVEWYRKAAGQGYDAAQVSLGLCYENGTGVEKNIEKAVEWYRKAAEQGNAWAQYNLGNCYNNGLGVAKDYKQAVEWYRKSAEQGNANAQINLGFCYDNGLGVAKDYKQAVEWYRKAAEQGDAMAQYNLGVCYENGEGVTKSMEQAIQWYSKAAEQGYADAKRALQQLIRR